MSIPLNMKSAIIKYSFSAAAVGVPGAFAAHADVPVLVGLWSHMILNLATKADCKMDLASAAKIAAGIAAGVSAMIVGVKAANSYFAYTGVGTPFAVAANATANGAATWMVGRSISELLLEKEMDDIAHKALEKIAFMVK